MTILAKLASDVQLMIKRPPRIQFAAICYRREKKTKDLQVLLITSRDTGRWVIPKGWPMNGKPAHKVAEQEAYEEAGVIGKAEKASFGNYLYGKKLKSSHITMCSVQVHLLDVEDMLSDFPEKGTRSLEWVSCETAAERVQEPELKTLFARFAEFSRFDK